MRTQEINTTSLDETIKLAEKIGGKLRGGEAIELISDLGGGKTTFVRGLAKGIGSKDAVRSPSFTLSNEYRANSLTLYHFDFYRLNDPGIMRDELAEVVAEPDSVVAVEWGTVVNDVLPNNRLTVEIKPTGVDSRKLIFSYPEEFEYLIENT